MNKKESLNSKMPITWCPGCPNNVVLYALKSALEDLIASKKILKRDVVIVTDIGCGGKMYDYLNLNAFYGLHGRAIPIAVGVKLGNPKLTVIAIAGDGGTYSEGVNHLAASGRMNPDITAIVLNNGVLALTKGQATPTNRLLIGNSDLNPIAMALASKASFVGRETTFDLASLQSTIKAAINHKGFSLVDIIEPCLSYNNNAEWLRKNIERRRGQTVSVADFGEKSESKIKTGVFRKKTRPTLEENLGLLKTGTKKRR
ncbi:MAG: thiamine pyrophosphate-dependent enzyme [Patescibacteria group bacterium]|nr:thiamine pyrophosphate-dependent enzyme [Patescibacteria group bacterium]MCL5261995.1 thiamine pyrophosphate-dependent enzyme [Patescibacteria group bacterium]